jgi:hypothetical protein
MFSKVLEIVEIVMPVLKFFLGTYMSFGVRN